jgi:hypothetical protein
VMNWVTMAKFWLVSTVILGSVETLVTHTVRVEVTTIWIADTIIVASYGAIFSRAASLALDCIRVRCISRRDEVGFPNIHLVAAGAIVSGSSHCVVRIRNPSLTFGLKVN